MKNTPQAVIAYAKWESGDTPAPYYDKCIITLYNMTDSDIVNPLIAFTLAAGQQPSQDLNFAFSVSGSSVSGYLTDNNRIPVQGSVEFAIGINGGEVLGALPTGFVVNGASADAPPDSEAPSVPQGVTVTGTGAKTASLVWQPSTDNVLVVGYIVEYAAGSGKTQLSVDAASAIITGLTELTAYTATVKAVDVAGNTSAISDVVSFTTQTAVPDPGEYRFSVAPYIDYMAYPQLTTGMCLDASGIKNYTLAFIVAGTSSADNTPMPAWGGQSDPAFDARTSSLAKDDIAALRAAGGDVAISFGGSAGIPIEEAVADTDTLIDWYQEIIDNYALKYIDFDLEGEVLAQPDVLTRHVVVVEAIMRANPSLQVSYTLPVDGQNSAASQGLSSYGIDFIAMLADADILPSMINGMTMDFGADSPADMFTGVKNALDAMNTQIVANWPQLSAKQAWRRTGATPMFGDNDVQGQTFTLDNQSQLLDYAKKVNLGMLSGWSENRDHDLFAWGYSKVIADYQHKDA
ncbi:fibronectin type III domain-containing protein [Lelliottia wanjuensis]|uniref:fibronectin type III domain-containing protein n=1 Tax=Lelliottia wanjuensis TaxID=3050585 RepID=UPI00254CA9C8|nr:fibronectin type III domain-containing protein [Lelliottia sp. V86_10]MDK9587567.1 fibronectin type III domain-containing protein [Lelliottia sp. V86_10]